MEKFEIHLPGKTIQTLQLGQVPVVRLDVEAYNVLAELTNESNLSMKQVASIIIKEASKHVVFDREEINDK